MGIQPERNGGNQQATVSLGPRTPRATLSACEESRHCVSGGKKAPCVNLHDPPLVRRDTTSCSARFFGAKSLQFPSEKDLISRIVDN